MDGGTASEALREVQAALDARWPEQRIAPSLQRIAALVDLLGDPQRAYPVIHVTGTNGKTSTARMIDTLLRGFGIRTGRFTSPHLDSLTERICLDGEPIDDQRFVDTWADVAPYVEVVDTTYPGTPMSYFEVLTGMAYAAFADAPVDVAVVEVGMGGTWDATNVADGAVGVVTPIGLDHADYLGDTLEAIAAEKAGILKPEQTSILGVQDIAAATVLLRHAAEVGARVAREGLEFGVRHRDVAVGGQLLALQGLGGMYEDVFLPLHGEHQAHNAACALAAAEAFLGGGSDRLDPDVVRMAFAGVTSPGRLELVRRSPSVLVDAAHNPHGAAALAAAVGESFGFAPLIGVVAVLDTKDARGIFAALEPVLDAVVVTQSSSPRSLPAADLAALAAEVLGPDRVEMAARLDDAVEAAVRLAEGEAALGGAGVLVTGSVVTAADARRLLGAGRR